MTPDGASFDLVAMGRRGLAAGVGLTGIGALLGLGAWFDGSTHAVRYVGAGFGGVLVLLGVLVLGTFAVSVLSGGDRLQVDATGLRRINRAQGFHVTWSEIGRIGFVIAEVAAGYDDRLAGQRSTARPSAPFRWPGANTMTHFGKLHLQPVAPDTFAQLHKHLDAARHPGRERLVDGRFGTVVAASPPDLRRIGEAIAHFAGSRYDPV